MQVNDPFSLSPLLSLLPLMGDVRELSGFSAAFFARFEEVTELIKDAELSDLAKQELQAEHTMLRQVLDWLAIRPE